MRPRSPFLAYGAPLAASIAVTLFKLSFPRALGLPAPFLLYGIVVVTSGWLLGFRSAIVALAAGALESFYFFVPSVGSFHDKLPEGVIQLGIFILEGLIVSGVIASLDASGRAAQSTALERGELLKRERQARAHLQVLSELTRDLSTALGREQISELIVERGTRAVGADICTLYVLDESDRSLELLAARGVAPELLERIRGIGAGSEGPVFDSLHSGEAVWVESEKEYAALYPTLSRMSVSRAKAFWSVPLLVEGRAYGLLGMGFEAPRTFPAAEREFVRTFTQHCAQALRRAQLYEAELRARAHAERAQLLEQESRAAADAANRAKDDFLAMISHELRTPLNAILGWARMLRTGQLEPAKQKKALDAVDRNAIAMNELIEDLLDVSRIVSGRMRLEFTRVDPLAVVEAALDDVRPTAENKQIHIERELDGTAGPVLGDASRLQQVVLNLLSNAVKFTPAGGRVQVSLRTLDAEIEIRVSDTGRGIAAEFLPHVFVPFRQADGSITRFHGGLGLGLSIAKQLVELHQGRVESHSEGEGRGATFVVRIPLLDSELQVESARRAAEFRLGRPTANVRHVLLVDDDPDTRQLLQTILETAGFRTTAAENVENALQLLKQELPDLLISDIGLPGTDGYELIRQVRMLPEAKARGVPALALTAYSRSEDRARALRAGFAMHIPKPVEPAALVAAVETLCPPTARQSSATSNA